MRSLALPAKSCNFVKILRISMETNKNLMKKLLSFALALCGLLITSNDALAQRAALRTNLLGLAVGNINIDASHMISSKMSVHLSLQAKPFDFPLPAPVGLIRWAEGLENSTQYLAEFGTIKHTENYTIQPGVRYWMRGVYNRGVFFGLQAIGTIYKYGGDKFSSSYRDGWGVGAGLSVGYSRELAKRLNLELEIGIGALYRSYNFVNTTSGYKNPTTVTDQVPTVSKLGISLVYLL